MTAAAAGRCGRPTSTADRARTRGRRSRGRGQRGQHAVQQLAAARAHVDQVEARRGGRAPRRLGDEQPQQRARRTAARRARWSGSGRRAARGRRSRPARTAQFASRPASASVRFTLRSSRVALPNLRSGPCDVSLTCLAAGALAATALPGVAAAAPPRHGGTRAAHGDRDVRDPRAVRRRGGRRRRRRRPGDLGERARQGPQPGHRHREERRAARLRPAAAARCSRSPRREAPGPDDEPGRFNNVDLVDRLPARAGRLVDLAVVTDRGRDKLRFYRIDPTPRLLTDVTAAGRAVRVQRRPRRRSTSRPPRTGWPRCRTGRRLRTPWSAAGTPRSWACSAWSRRGGEGQLPAGRPAGAARRRSGCPDGGELDAVRRAGRAARRSRA